MFTQMTLFQHPKFHRSASPLTWTRPRRRQKLAPERTLEQFHLQTCRPLNLVVPLEFLQST